jgi:hypothetical protein
MSDGGDVLLVSDYLGGAKMTVMGALQAGWVVRTLATTGPPEEKQRPAGSRDRRGARMPGAAIVVEFALPFAGTHRLQEAPSLAGAMGPSGPADSQPR